MPLQVRLNVTLNETCNAGLFCLHLEQLLSLDCSFCGRKFHLTCVSPPIQRKDSCGCHRIPLMIDHSRFNNFFFFAFEYYFGVIYYVIYIPLKF